MTETTARATGARLQKNVLSLPICIALSVALMGPVLAVVLNAPAAGPQTGAALPLGFLIALIVILFVATAVTLALRTTSSRIPPLAITELALVGLALAGVVAAHRDGAINHPRMLSDWAWTHAIDPVRIFGVELDRSHVTAAVEISLCFGKRHKYEGGVVFRQEHLELWKPVEDAAENELVREYGCGLLK